MVPSLKVVHWHSTVLRKGSFKGLIYFSEYLATYSPERQYLITHHKLMFGQLSDLNVKKKLLQRLTVHHQMLSITQHVSKAISSFIRNIM
jgi:hypothetical protein